jgi:hypothetical protein
VLEGWAVERSAYLEGIERRGQVQLARTYLELVLRTRLKRELPADVMEAIQRQTDPATLDRWFHEALEITTLDDARRLLGLAAA